MTRTLAIVLAAAIHVSAFAQAPAPAELSKKDAASLDQLGRAFAKAFLAADGDALRALCPSAELLKEVVVPKVLERTPKLHKLMLDSNAARLTAFRKRFADLDGFAYVRVVPGYRLKSSAFYANAERVLKNSMVVIAFANRIELRIKLEEVVLIGGSYRLVKLD